MGLDAVLAEIRAQGQGEAQGIKAEADKQVATIMAQADKDAAAVTATVTKETKGRVAALERELLGASEFEARRRELSTRRELLDDFRSRVLEALEGLPDEKRAAVLDKLVARAKKDLGEGVAHGPASSLAHASSNGYEKGEERPGAGGFVVESGDGDVLLDLRFETLLDDAWKQVLVACRDILEVQ